jgi:D-glycero-D-manno-heptose 1,7-bisphosphate phosphatase
LKRAVFLDRDGVINRNIVRDGRPYAPTSIAEFEILPGVAAAVRCLREAGFLAIVVTNQPDVAVGKQSVESIAGIHQLLLELVPVDDIKICYHTDTDACECRKPKPGMLLAAARDHNIELTRSYMVGDRWRDIEAGKAARCATIFIDHEYDEPRPENPDAVVANLTQAAQWILRREEEQAT